MADSKRQKIVSAIIARMQTILVTNGYETDLGLHVADWQTNWQEEELDNGALSVCDLVADEDGDENGDPTSSGAMSIHTMPVMLRIFTNSNTPAATLRKMIADVKKAIKSDPRWKVSNVGLAIKTVPVRSGLVMSDNSFEVAGAAVEVEISFITKLFDEYS